MSTIIHPCGLLNNSLNQELAIFAGVILLKLYVIQTVIAFKFSIAMLLSLGGRVGKENAVVRCINLTFKHSCWLEQRRLSPGCPVPSPPSTQK